MTLPGKIPLYQVKHKLLHLAEIQAVFSPHLEGMYEIIEVVFEHVYYGKVSAVGIFNGLRAPMKHLFTQCDYHAPVGHFIAIEPDEVQRMHDLFPGRFARVGLVYERLYSK